MKGLSAQCIALKVDKTRKYTVCRHVHVSFSSEFLQAGAVKGLTSTETTRLTRDGEKGGEGAWRWGKR